MSSSFIPTRRFIVDGHDGKDYWYDEYDEFSHPGIEQMNENELMQYLRNICWKDCKCQIYSVCEIRGNYTFEQLMSLSIITVSELLHEVYYNHTDRSLESYRNTLK